MVADAFDHDSAMANANMETVPMAMKKGCAAR